MSHKHAKVLREIFKDPASGNIHWREVESLLNHLGARIEQHSGAAMHVFINDVEGVVHRPHHGGTFSKQEVRHLRDYLAAAGVTPARYESG